MSAACRHLHPGRPSPTLVRRLGVRLWGLLALACAAPGAAAYCESAADDRRPLVELPDAAAVRQGRVQLTTLVRDALTDNADVRGADHARRAAGFDLTQAQAAALPQVGLVGQGGLAQTFADGSRLGSGVTAAVGLNAGAVLYDGGKLEQLTAYRRSLVDASLSGTEVARERVARDVVLAALERNRYRSHYKAHQQHVARLTCLTVAVEQIVARDRGRASELLQARKGLQQAEVARDEVLAALRQADARLRVWVGDQVQPWTALGAPLVDLPTLDELHEQLPGNPDVRQLRQQGDAQARLARASAADRAPQLRWELGANARRDPALPGRQTHGWNAGVALNYTLDDGGSVQAATQAAEERALASRRALDAALAERRKQVATLHDMARSALQRAGRYSDILEDSDRLRDATYTQWARLGRRSLFDLISAESEHHQLRLAQVNAHYDGLGSSVQLRALGTGLLPWLMPGAGSGGPPAR